MSRRFAEWVRERMAALDLTNEELTALLRAALAAAGDRAPDASIAPAVTHLRGATVAERASGQGFFLDPTHPARLAALAAALHVAPSEIRARKAESDRCRTLVLDPRLPPPVRGFLLQQQSQPGAAYDCVQVPGGPPEPVWERLRSAALDEGDEALVVLPEEAADQDGLYLEGAGVTFTSAYPVPRGYRLEGWDGLVPIPPPPPPPRFDALGAPLRPLAEGEHRPGKEWEWRMEALWRKVRDADALGELPVFRVDEAVTWFSVPGGALAGKNVKAGVPSLDRLLADEKAGDPTYVWAAGDRLYAHGPARRDVAALFEGWHEVHRLPWVDEVARVAGDARANPWSLVERLEPVLGEVGVEWRGWANERSAILQRGLAERIRAARATRAAVATDVNEQERARAALRALAEREVGPDAVSYLFVLARAAEAPLVTRTPLDAGTRLHVVADMGAGNLLELIVLSLDGPSGGRLEWRTVAIRDEQGRDASTSFLVGGDVLVAPYEWRVGLLEGSALPVRSRRGGVTVEAAAGVPVEAAATAEAVLASEPTRVAALEADDTSPDHRSPVRPKGHAAGGSARSQRRPRSH